MKLTAMTGEELFNDYKVVTSFTVDGFTLSPVKVIESKARWLTAIYEVPENSEIKFLSIQVGNVPAWGKKDDIIITFTATNEKLVDFHGHSKYSGQDGVACYGWLQSSEAALGLPIVDNFNRGIQQFSF